MAETDRFASCMPTAARLILGDPNEQLSSREEWRYGAHGSLSIIPKRGTWYDNEAKEGGGTVAFVQRELHCDIGSAIEWLENNAGLPARDERPAHKNGAVAHKAEPKRMIGERAPIGKIVATYDYCDEAGDLLFQVLRYEPKTFRQRRPDGAGGWTWQVRGVRQVPYRLHEIQEALAGDKPIYIAEGEKDVDALIALGAPATCNPGGAGKWSDDLSEALRGAYVVILPDNDDAGRAHRDLIAEKLNAAGCDVRILDLPDLPEKGDPSDWIAKGGTLAKLYALTDAKAHRIGEGDKLRATPFDPAEVAALTARAWVYGTLAIRKFVSAVGSPGGVGKTAYTVAVALAVVTGRALLDERVHASGAAWLFNLEDGRDEMMRRVAAAMQRHQITDEDVAGKLYIDSGREQALIIAEKTKDGGAVATPRYQELRAEMARVRPALLIVDPFVNSHALEENRNEQVNVATRLWAQIADEFNCAVILVHHFAKGGVPGEADAFRGAKALIDGTRSAVTLARMSREEADHFGVEEKDRPRMVRLDNAKLNLAPPPDRANWIELTSVRLHTGDYVQAAAKFAQPSQFAGLSAEQCDRILLAFETGGPWSPSKQARHRWGGVLIQQEAAKLEKEVSEVQSGRILSAWLTSGALEIYTYERDSKKREALRLNHGKRPGRIEF